MLISVITPAYNRAHTLGNAWRSLHRQRVPLEWIVVDDGSTDDSARVMAEFARDSPFPVSYLLQDHVGKWAAVNRGVTAARGDMIAQLDSDDWLTPAALDRLAGHWAAIPDPRGYAGVTGLEADESGRVAGDRFPADIIDSTWQEMHYRHRVGGDKWGIQRTDVMRAHPFPPSVGFEGLVWRKIGRGYRTRYVNEVFLTYRTTGTDHFRQIYRRPTFSPSAARFYADILNEDTGYFACAPDIFMKYAANYIREMLHQRIPVHRHTAWLHTWPARGLWTAAVPLGLLLFRRDLYREAERR